MGVYFWTEYYPELCFTAEQANSTVQLTKTGTPTGVSLETSTEGKIWSSYTIGDTITLSNVGDKVYFRNTSEITTGFNIDSSNYYQFVMSGSIAASGDTTSLLNKNGANTVGNRCFYRLFYQCTSLTTAPELPATNLGEYCYDNMFNGCTSLTSIHTLPATTLYIACYRHMFRNCTSLSTLPKLPATTLVVDCYFCMFFNSSNIKLSTTQTGEYQTGYRIPVTGTGTDAADALAFMFSGTGGTFDGSPSINTTYYTSNTVI